MQICQKLVSRQCLKGLYQISKEFLYAMIKGKVKNWYVILGRILHGLRLHFLYLTSDGAIQTRVEAPPSVGQSVKEKKKVEKSENFKK